MGHGIDEGAALGGYSPTNFGGHLLRAPQKSGFLDGLARVLEWSHSMASGPCGKEESIVGNATTWSAWAQVMTVVAAIVGAAWGLAWSLSGNFERLGAAVAGNAAAIERNAAAIERNAAAIERNATAIERNATAIQSNATAIERVQASVDAGRAVMAENATAIARLAGQYAEHVRRHDKSGKSSALAAAR